MRKDADVLAVPVGHLDVVKVPVETRAEIDLGRLNVVLGVDPRQHHDELTLAHTVEL